MMHLNQLGKYVDSKDYNAWVYAKTIDESETKWEVFKEKHDTKEDSWLEGMYKVCEHWIKDYFFVRMTSKLTE